MSNVILEALDYKKIIIAKTNMSIKLNDILRNNKNSVLVNSHNVIDCAKTVSLVIEDDKFMEFISGNTQKSIVKFSLQVVFDKWMKLLL